jgi:ABC-2 type transport system permease protein
VAVDRSQAGSWKAYDSFFRRAFSSHLAYATSYWLNLVATAGVFSLTLLIWASIRPAQGPEGARFFAYLCLAYALNFSLGFTLERHIGERIREGLIATDLLKPVDMGGLIFIQALSDGMFQCLFAFVAVGLGVWALGPAAMAPASASAAGLSVLSLLLAILVQFHICYLFVQLIFFTNSNYGPFSTRQVLHNIFAGLFAPLDVFPPALRRIAEALPFHHVVYTPIAIYQGRLSQAETWPALGSQLLWATGLFVVSRWSFDRIRRSLSIQGG